MVLRACCCSCRYVTVDSEAGRALFYLLVEAEGGAASKPLILWTNGGPGCASSGGGFIAEHGPWYPNAYVERNGLRRNNYAWNRAASVVYLDQPAFTGFSYSNRSSDRYAGAAVFLCVLGVCGDVWCSAPWLPPFVVACICFAQPLHVALILLTSRLGATHSAPHSIHCAHLCCKQGVS